MSGSNRTENVESPLRNVRRFGTNSTTTARAVRSRTNRRRSWRLRASRVHHQGVSGELRPPRVATGGILGNQVVHVVQLAVGMLSHSGDASIADELARCHRDSSCRLAFDGLGDTSKPRRPGRGAARKVSLWGPPFMDVTKVEWRPSTTKPKEARAQAAQG